MAASQRDAAVLTPDLIESSTAMALPGQHTAISPDPAISEVTFMTGVTTA